LDELKPRVKKLLNENEELAKLSQSLATITTNAPVDLNLEACQVGDFGSEPAVNALEKLRFKSLIKELTGNRTNNKASYTNGRNEGEGPVDNRRKTNQVSPNPNQLQLLD
jgi:DNA polymerase-1